MNRRGPNTWKKLWFAPALIALFSLIGLLSALSGDGHWDVLSWGCLGVPCFVIAFYLIKGLNLKN